MIPKLSKLFRGGGWKKTKDITKGHDLRQSVCLNACVCLRESFGYGQDPLDGVAAVTWHCLSVEAHPGA